MTTSTTAGPMPGPALSSTPHTTHSATPRSTPSSTDPPSTREERSERTRDLLERAHGEVSPEAREALLHEVVLINRGVAQAVASRFRGRGLADDDLQQTAFEGLIKAVHRFDPQVRPDLLTYAVPTIRGEIRRHFRDRGWMVRPPRRVQELQWQVSRSIEHLSHQLGREPSTSEIGADLGCAAEEVVEAVAGYGAYAPTSIDQPTGGSEDLTLADTLADDDREETASEARLVLRPAMKALSDRDREVVYLRFFEERTQTEIGDRLGVTQMQVSRLLARILRDLKGEIATSA